MDRNKNASTARVDREGARQPRPLAFVVDDDEATLGMLCEIVEDRGWRSRSFTRLRDVGPTLRREHPAMLILDDNLPDGSGGDLARHVRDDPGMSDVFVVVCTAAHPMRQAEINAWAPVVSKPFAIADLERFMDAAAGHHGGVHRREAG